MKNIDKKSKSTLFLLIFSKNQKVKKYAFLKSNCKKSKGQIQIIYTFKGLKVKKYQIFFKNKTDQR